MHVIEKGCYLEIVSDCPGSLVLLLSLPETGNGLLGPELKVGQLGPRVGGQRLPEVAHLPPSRHVQLPSATRCRLYVASQLLSDRMLVTSLSDRILLILVTSLFNILQIQLTEHH